MEMYHCPCRKELTFYIKLLKKLMEYLYLEPIKHRQDNSLFGMI